MKFLYHTWKGLSFILLIIVLNAFIWWFATPIIDQSIESKIGQIMASNIIIVFTFVFFLSTKNRLVTWLFKGLENVYIYHRTLAILAILMIFLHGQFAYLIYQYFTPNLPIRPVVMGEWARNIFIALVVIALLAKYLNYERWRTIHRFMILPYLMGAYHAIFISSYDLVSFTLLGLWFMMILAIGIGSSVYMIVFYRKTALTFKGKVENIIHITDQVTEVHLKMDDAYNYDYGQFAFLKINKQPFKGVPHPFSISGGKDDLLTFNIKALGDYTLDIKNTLKTNDTVYLSQPYGHMVFENYPGKQVWIAGGIGITPFLSYLRHLDKVDQEIILYYTVKEKHEAVDLKLMETLDKTYPNFTFVLWESNQVGYLSIDKIDLSNHPTVFMCGPLSMAKTLKKQLKQKKQHKALVYEAFSFAGTLVEDLHLFLKKLIRKLRKAKT